MAAENHWVMMAWLSKFIEKNKFNWERRREIQENEYKKSEEYEKWKNKPAEEQLEEIRLEAEQGKRTREKPDKDKTWKTWRTRDEDRRNYAGEHLGLDDMMVRTLEMKQKRKMWRAEKEETNKRTIDDEKYEDRKEGEKAIPEDEKKEKQEDRKDGETAIPEGENEYRENKDLGQNNVSQSLATQKELEVSLGDMDQGQITLSLSQAPPEGEVRGAFV